MHRHRTLDLHCAVIVLLQHRALALVFFMSHIIVHTRYHLVLSLCILIMLVLLFMLLQSYIIYSLYCLSLLQQHRARALVFCISDIIMHTHYHVTLSHLILLLLCVIIVLAHSLTLYTVCTLSLSYPKCCCSHSLYSLISFVLLACAGLQSQPRSTSRGCDCME